MLSAFVSLQFTFIRIVSSRRRLLKFRLICHTCYCASFVWTITKSRGISTSSAEPVLCVTHRSMTQNYSSSTKTACTARNRDCDREGLWSGKPYDGGRITDKIVKSTASIARATRSCRSGRKVLWHPLVECRMIRKTLRPGRVRSNISRRDIRLCFSTHQAPATYISRALLFSHICTRKEWFYWKI